MAGCVKYQAANHHGQGYPAGAVTTIKYPSALVMLVVAAYAKVN